MNLPAPLEKMEGSSGICLLQVASCCACCGWCCRLLVPAWLHHDPMLFFSEHYLVSWDKHGLPKDLNKLHNMCCLFTVFIERLRAETATSPGV